MGKIKDQQITSEEYARPEDDMSVFDYSEAANLGRLPTLYKKTNTGAIQFWEICVLHVQQTGFSDIHTRFGQLNTDSPQETADTIKKGKNIGKKNETSVRQQAEAEALAKWEKQKKKGYVETQAAAEAGEVDELIEGGIVPMLAHKYSEQGHKIKYPAFIQPKLDGIRCIAIVKDGQATLWTRTRKPITSMPHIVQELEAAFENMDIILDGELYNHDYKNNFEKIVSLVRSEEPIEGHEVVQFHVYDSVSNEEFKFRYAQLHRLFRMFEFMSLILVQTEVAQSEDTVMDFFDKYRNQGYEGAMLRNVTSLYANKRSYDLQKVKEFDDAEFQIVGIEEGRGKLAGHVGSFVCMMDTQKQFLAKAKGETSKLKEYFDNHQLWKGKKLTVQYQGLTGKEGVPRFPVGISIRDYE